MKGRIGLISLLAFGLTCVGAQNFIPKQGMETIAVNEVTLNGDLLGAARFDYTKVATVSSDVLAVCEINVGGEGNSDYSGSGVYIRMRNLTGINTYMIFKLNSTNGTVLQPAKGAFQHYLLTDGTDVTASITATAESRPNDRYLMLPANFDGYVYMNYETDMEKVEGTSDFDPAHVWRIYFEISKMYDNYAKFDIGDIQTDTKKVLDVSELDETAFATTFIQQATASDVVVTQLSKEAPIDDDFDYGTATYIGSTDGGAQINGKYYKKIEEGIVRITLPEQVDLSNALALTFKAQTTGTFPFKFRMFDKDGRSLTLPYGITDATTTKVLNVAEGESVANGFIVGGDTQSIKCPGTFSGTFVFPIANMEPDVGTINLAKVAYFEIGVAVHFDYDIDLIIGDIGYIKKDTHQNIIFLDASEETFEDVYSVTALPENIFVKQFSSKSNCERIGDTKILNSFDVESVSKLEESVSWNPGDNLCTYSVESNAMKVHIGPFEIGHTYGSYMALKISNGEKRPDYNFYDINDKGERVYAKGLQVYVKNLSMMDIGVNLQFDDLTAGKYERWILKGYPAMYYAYDVNTGREYTMFSKSDQFQIPVGFEGYIRLPFDQYQVPDWCIQQGSSDGVLNLGNFNSEFYLTSDNTRYEDLEYLIKNVGVYFNETKAATLFDDTNSIKSNLGLNK